MEPVELPFPDRHAAGRLLAMRLGHIAGADGLVLALPRGGVAVGYQIALALRLPLDVFLARKLGSPWSPEYALGAVAETGDVELNAEVMERGYVDDAYVERELARQRAIIEQQRSLYRGGRPLPAVQGRMVILVDDGVATGLTMRVALCALRRQEPARLILGVPVGPPHTIDDLACHATEAVCLATPEEFYAVGAHYRDFGQLTDDQVVALLQGAAAQRA